MTKKDASRVDGALDGVAYFVQYNPDWYSNAAGTNLYLVRRFKQGP